MNESDIYKHAICLKQGPLSQIGLDFVKEVIKIPDTTSGNILKTMITFYIFTAKKEIFEKIQDPTPGILQSLRAQTEFIKAYNKLNQDYFFIGANIHKQINFNNSNDYTSFYYGELFKNFEFDKYYVETVENLKQRLEINNVFPENLSTKNVLDAGCGAGKYSLAWKKIGAKNVTGIDFSETNINESKKRLANTDFKIDFQVQDILNLSFNDDSFDIVYCNGVLHHTKDFDKGVSELVRVLKKGGFGWLYVIENPGGYFWDIIEILRLVMKGVDYNTAINTLKLMNLKPQTIFRVLDHVMVPINKRSTEIEVQKALKNAGAKDIKRLKRGVYFDRIEKIYNKEPFATLKYGGGEQIFAFSK